MEMCECFLCISTVHKVCCIPVSVKTYWAASSQCKLHMAWHTSAVERMIHRMVCSSQLLTLENLQNLLLIWEVVMLIECKLGSVTGHSKYNCCKHLVLSMDVTKHFGPSLDIVANVMLQGAWWLDVVANMILQGTWFQPVDVVANVTMQGT